jgi:hypothetical protein
MIARNDAGLALRFNLAAVNDDPEGTNWMGAVK